MDLDGQHHDRGALTTGKINLVPTKNVAVWVHEPVRILCR